MLSEIKGILFDKDGTLFDFHSTWTEVVERVIEELTPDSQTRSELASLGGYIPEHRKFLPGSPLVAASTREIAEIWNRALPEKSVDEIETLCDAFGAAASTDDALVPASRDLDGLLSRLRARGIALGVATHDSEDNARAQLTAVGVLDHFAFVAGYDSGFELKPAPAMLVGFAEKVGLRPADIAMVGDSIGDLKMVANARAGLAIGVLSGPAGREGLAPFADYVVDTIDALDELV